MQNSQLENTNVETLNNERNYQKIKYSVGIACCRRENVNKPMQILLIQRRNTYCFQAFIFGQYSIYSISKIKYLIKNMTVAEQNDLLTMNFEFLWMQLTRQKKEMNLSVYNFKIQKFNNLLTRIDLKGLIFQYNSA